MNLSNETLQKVEDIKHKLHSANRTMAVRSAVDITETVLNTLTKGGKIILEEANGERFLMTIPGVR